MTTGTGIAILGVWLFAGVVAHSPRFNGAFVVIVMAFALLSTAILVAV